MPVDVAHRLEKRLRILDLHLLTPLPAKSAWMYSASRRSLSKFPMSADTVYDCAMTSVWGEIDMPTHGVARTNRITRGAALIAIAGLVVFGFFYFVWDRVVTAEGSGVSASLIGLNRASHPILFSGFNLGAWPTLAFGVILFVVGLISTVRPSGILAWTSFISLVVISVDILWEGTSKTPRSLGFPSTDIVKFGGAVALLFSALAGLVISWFYVKRFNLRPKRSVSANAPR